MRDLFTFFCNVSARNSNFSQEISAIAGPPLVEDIGFYGSVRKISHVFDMEHKLFVPNGVEVFVFYLGSEPLVLKLYFYKW
ncbi:hypothetical protein Pyn_10821 [Prunus yedoensis var. nudiflora]|uniref:Uncharacterized protein n=1 Tax=Prunus yedoensis var. nudiflora TaxID=2094558 RepID=A0A314XMK1_PRUYE|nr:hypothetical protein Pyn_10821 [Prunus yedoensis var. nudiflora]